MTAQVDGPGGGEVTIGVAIPVPPPYAEELQAWRADFGDPLALSIPAHVTLVPPTRVAEAVLDDLRDHLAGTAAVVPPFRMTLTGTATFRPVSPVVFVRVEDGAGQCAELERRLRCGVLDGDRRFPYHPHVTVAHEVDEEALDRAAKTLAEYEAEFAVGAVVLYTHGPDGVWRPAAEFVLGAG